MQTRTKALALIVLSTTVTSSLLAGCATSSLKEPTQNQTVEGRLPVTPSAATPAPSGSESESLHGVPVGHTCQNLISLQALYDFNPNFSLTTSQKPIQPTVSAPYERLAGITCLYMNQTSGEVIQLSIAKITEDALQIPGTAFATAGRPVSTLSNIHIKVFFEENNGNFIFRLVNGNYLLAVSSALLSSAEDNFKFISPALKNI